MVPDPRPAEQSVSARGELPPSRHAQRDGDDDAVSAVIPRLEGVAEDTRWLGRYLLRYRLAYGGMATVYLAQHRADGGFCKLLAIKCVHPHLTADPRLVRMFLDEARLTARLDHPNICTVFDFGREGDTYFLAMEYLHGESLGAVLGRAAEARSALPLAVAARIVADAARGLHAAHELRDPAGEPAGVVHRDVSPQNIFVLYDGITKVVDFGIARCNDRAGDATALGELKGKLGYMAPEQLRFEAVDRRIDVFAAGIVLWEATTGRRLFRRETAALTIAAVQGDPIPRPSDLVPGYPAELEQVVMRALEREPARRFQTAEELARALERFLARDDAGAGASEVGAHLRALFPDRIAARAELVRRALAPPPAPDAAPSAPAPSLRAESTVTAPRGDATPAAAPAQTAPARRARWVVAASLATVAALAVVAARWRTAGVATGATAARATTTTTTTTTTGTTASPRAVVASAPDEAPVAQPPRERAASPEPARITAPRAARTSRPRPAAARTTRARPASDRLIDDYDQPR